MPRASTSTSSSSSSRPSSRPALRLPRLLVRVSLIRHASTVSLLRYVRGSRQSGQSSNPTSSPVLTRSTMYGIALSSPSRLLSYTSASQPKIPSPGTLRISSLSSSASAITQENNRRLFSASRLSAREKRSHLLRTSLALSDSHTRPMLPPGQTYHAL